MLEKLFSLLIRCGITFGIGWAVGAAIGETLHNESFALMVAFAIWLFGGIYSFLKFNAPYNIFALKNTENQIIEVLDKRNKRKIEDDMLKIKQLLDNGILTQDEYDKKIQELKNKYL